VKLAQRGRDFLKAVLFAAIVSSILDVKLVLAACFSLLMAAGISEALLAASTTGQIRVDLEQPQLSCFKGGSVKERITIRYRRTRLVRVLVSAVKGPDGVDTVPNDSTDALSLTFQPKYAGRFEGLRVTFDFLDPLGLFRKTLEVTREDFVIDCYPASLLKEVRQTPPITLALGERSGRSHGTGQEFYSIDEYNPSVEKKNIYWKKIASLPDERLLVKIRESNIPQAITIGLVRTVPRDTGDLEWMDLACEGAGDLGSHIFSLGCDVNLVYFNDDKLTNLETTDLLEFRQSLMRMSLSQLTGRDCVSEILYECDICITGFKELEDDLFAGEVARKPSLLIKEGDSLPRTLGNLSLIYSGIEDVEEIVNRVVRR
jgi:hypothetical protein